jgi:hypothetical protein
MWQQIVIGVVVPVAAGYVTWTFLSLRRRQRLLDLLATLWPATALRRAAERHRLKLAAPGCGNCGAHAPLQPLHKSSRRSKLAGRA